MGFSFSGLSLVTTAAAELGAGDVVSSGARSGSPGPKPFLSGGESVREEEGGSTDSDSRWPLAAVYAGAEGTPLQPKDAPPPTSLFSSLWTSALGSTEPESAGADPDSFSILTSEELLSARGAFAERPPAVVAANSEAMAAAAGDLWKWGAGALAAQAGTIAKQAVSSLPEAALPSVSPVPPRAIESEVEAALETVRQAGAATKEAAGTEMDGVSAGKKTPQSLALADINGSLESRQALREAKAARLSESLDAGTAKGRENGSDLATDGNALDPDYAPAARGKELVDPGRAAPHDIANALAAAEKLAAADKLANLASNATPNAATSSSPARAVPQANALPAIPRGLSVISDSSTTQTSAKPPQSEIAFQAELQLTNGQAAPNAPASDTKGETLTRWTTSVLRDDAPVPGVNHMQPAESQPQAEAAATVAATASRKLDGHAETGTFSFDHDGAGGSLDRGAQQTSVPSQGTFVTAAKSGSENAATPKPPATTAAAQLDAVAPPAPPDTGRAAQSVALKIQSAGHGAANVVLTDRGGQVHVTVHSSDPVLAQSLRGDLGSLAGGLQQQGFDVKFLHPSSGSSLDAETRGNSNSSSDDIRGESRQRHSSDTDQHNRRRQDWAEEFD